MKKASLHSSSPLPAQPDFPAIEHEMQQRWEREGLLAAYLSKNNHSTERFSFLDGPITANNPMGVHHAWGRSLKDIFQRYQTMRGKRQRYQNGFDAQGLWVEVEVEKELGFTNKKDIEKYGIDRFVEKCKERVLKYAAIQTQQSKRLGYFMDWDHSYFTMSEENNYAIWHFLKRCHEKGLIYKGRDTVPWCPRCGTAISQHEILTEEYQEVRHRSPYVRFPLAGVRGKLIKSSLLVWTTTPWTLPVNVAIAVDPKANYVIVEVGGERLIVMKDRLSVLGAEGVVIDEFLGQELVGRNYLGPFDQLPAVRGVSKNHKVIDGKELVTKEDGTGLVHIAPGAGAEDYQLAKEEELPAHAPLNEEGVYLDGYGKFSGHSSPEVSKLVEEELKAANQLFKAEEISHRYPTCWRCKTELVFRLVDEWYIKMDPIRADMISAARSVKWLPEFCLDREIDWLNHMSDWLISKKRYWGLALPIFICSNNHVTVIGSKAELKEKAMAGFDQFDGHTPHRPWIDEVQVACEECGKSASRIPDVGNPWLDAGIVPFSTIAKENGHPPSYFTEKERSIFNDWFPVDLIAESFPGQFKNWFYSLLAMSVVLEGKAPMKQVVGHGLVRDEKGREMHKSSGNAIEFNEAADRVGADVMRWLYAKTPPAHNVNFGWESLEEVKRRMLMILYHSVRYLTELKPTEAKSSGWEVLLDEWLKAQLEDVKLRVTIAMNNFRPNEAAVELEHFVIEDLSQWYIRRSRGRADQAFAQTSRQVIEELLLLLAPIIPHLSDYLHRALDHDQSIHLSDWPAAKPSVAKADNEMTEIRRLASLAHEQRSQQKVKLRQPLRSATINAKLTPAGKQLLALEINVDEIKTGKVDDITLDTTIDEELMARGQLRELVRSIQAARRAAGLTPHDIVRAEIVSAPRQFEALLADSVTRAQVEESCRIRLHKDLHDDLISIPIAADQELAIRFDRSDRTTPAV